MHASKQSKSRGSLNLKLSVHASKQSKSRSSLNLKFPMHASKAGAKAVWTLNSLYMQTKQEKRQLSGG